MSSYVVAAVFLLSCTAVCYAAPPAGSQPVVSWAYLFGAKANETCPLVCKAAWGGQWVGYYDQRSSAYDLNSVCYCTAKPLGQPDHDMICAQTKAEFSAPDYEKAKQICPKFCYGLRRDFAWSGHFQLTRACNSYQPECGCKKASRKDADLVCSYRPIQWAVGQETVDCPRACKTINGFPTHLWNGVWYQDVQLCKGNALCGCTEATVFH